MAMITMNTNLRPRMYACMKECKKVYLYWNKLESHRLETTKKWKMFWKSLIRDTLKVWKDSPFPEWSRINFFWLVGTLLTVLSSSKSKLLKLKFWVWPILRMDEVDTATLTSRKRKGPPNKIWTKNLKSPKSQEQLGIWENSKPKTPLKFLCLSVTSKSNWKAKAVGAWLEWFVNNKIQSTHVKSVKQNLKRLKTKRKRSPECSTECLHTWMVKSHHLYSTTISRKKLP